MDVVIAGGHGKIALRLATQLAGQGHAVVSLVRNPEHADEVTATGARAVVADLETISIAELAEHLDGSDAVVFAAGAGPDSGAERKDTVDRAGATLLADAATKAGVRRYLLVSATGVDSEPDPGRGEVWAAYIAAKKAAEDAIRADPNLDATILRPGRLTDDPGTGKVLLAPPPVGSGDNTITRDDTAAVLANLLESPGTTGTTLELRGGKQPVVEAVAAQSHG
ncbi:MAG: SDR family oxidoreductase [Pseudonocardia sp.]|nr:SDR family oxidoreductase [Pseudonocardia sp.]